MRQVLADFREFEDGKAALKAKIDQEKEAAREKYTAKERAKMRCKDIPDGFDIAFEDRHDFLLSRSYTLTASGMSPALVEAALDEQAVDFIHGGRDWVRTEKAHNWIHNVANNPDLRRGDASWFYLRAEREIDHEPLVVQRYSQSPRHDLMIEIAESLPDKLRIEEAYDRIESDLKEFGEKFDRELNNDQVAVRRVREKCGFEVKRPYWIRRSSDAQSTDARSLGFATGEM